jgi:hypothetical protein
MYINFPHIQECFHDTSAAKELEACHVWPSSNLKGGLCSLQHCFVFLWVSAFGFT